jgi:4-amino-4-deoxy-L-arabinose transferase-like glycosyltransferase
VAQLWSWLLVGLIILFVAAVRVRLREMPLERDEGEYAYAGQLILQGVPPYLEACNMKLPGTYAAYALIMSIFGQTPASIHIGVMLVNVASILLVFLLGRKLLDDSAGIVAAASFALMSLSPSVLGLAGHATHFVTLFALAGILLLIKAVEVPPTVHRPQSTGQRPRSEVQSPKSKDSMPGSPGSPSSGRLFAAGLLLGLAFLMKQHGIFFGIFAVLFLLWNLFEPSPTDKDKARRPQLKTKNSKLKTPPPLHAPRSHRSPQRPRPPVPPHLPHSLARRRVSPVLVLDY